MIVDGKALAEEVLKTLHGAYTLGVVMNEGDAASQSFVRMKERVAERVGVTLKRFSPEQMDEALSCDGVVVQLPIENAEVLINQIPPEKDVDALGTHPLVTAPVAEAVKYILEKTAVDVRGRKTDRKSVV